jgi:hypothetical protein
MITTINGIATTPLMTADQNNALIGSRWTKLITTPINVAAAIALWKAFASDPPRRLATAASRR